MDIVLIRNLDIVLIISNKIMISIRFILIKLSVDRTMAYFLPNYSV